MPDHHVRCFEGLPSASRPRKGASHRGLSREDAHSHVSPDGFEYIVFKPSQIIHCYVLHCVYGAAEARQEYSVAAKIREQWQEPASTKKPSRGAAAFPSETLEAQFPAAAKAKKAGMKASAMKYFPYGFGSATGTSFLIEEVGEVDDDEEAYGSYQAERGKYGRESRSGVVGNWFDEYQTARTSKGKVEVDMYW